MRTDGKKTTLLILALVAIMLFALGLSFNSNKVDLFGKSAIVNAEESNVDSVFKVENAASIRLVPDETGIKFKVDINKTKFDEINAEYPNSNLTLKVVVDKYNNPDANEERVFSRELTQADFDISDKFTLYASILDRNLSAEEKIIASSMLLEASAYIEVSGAVPSRIDAEGTCVRNMTAVAKAIVDSGHYTNTDDLNTLKSYYGVSEELNNYSGKIDFLHKQLTFNDDISSLSSTYKNLYIGSRYIGELTANTVTLDDDVLDYLNYDSEYKIYLFDDDNNVRSFDAYAYAGIIYNAADFKNVFEISQSVVKQYTTERTDGDKTYYDTVNRQFKGNYILGNDIENVSVNHAGLNLLCEAKGTNFRNLNSSNNANELSNLMFGGTLDGQGYKISASLTANLGLFGFLSDANIKNVHFDITATGFAREMLCENIYGVLTLDNCYFTINSDSTANLGYNHTIVNQAAKLKLTNCVLNYINYTFSTGKYNGQIGNADFSQLHENTIILSNQPVLAKQYKDAVDAYYYASNEDSANYIAESTSDIKVPGLYRYENYLNFSNNKSSEISFEDFDNKYWECDSVGVPIFKSTAVLDFALQDYAEEGRVLYIETGNTLDIDATYGGLPLTNISATSVDAFITIEDNKITANSEGTGSIDIEYVLNGETISFTLLYEVTMSTIEVTTELVYSNTDGLLYGLSNTDIEISDITSMTFDGLNIAFSNNDRDDGSITLTGAVVTDVDIKSSAEIILKTDNNLYKFTYVTTVTKTIKTADDWTYFNIKNNDFVASGYVLVLEDVDTTSVFNKHGSGTVINQSEAISTGGFIGVLDGNGYTVKAKSSQKGLFYMMSNATIKDICLDVVVTGENDFAGDTGKINSILAGFATAITLDNVIIKVNSVEASAIQDAHNITLVANFFGRTDLRSTIKNLVLDYSNYTFDSAKSGGFFALSGAQFLFANNTNKTGLSNSFDNVYIIHNGSHTLFTTTTMNNATVNSITTVANLNECYADNDAIDQTKNITRLDNLDSVTMGSGITWTYSSDSGVWVNNNKV